MRDETKSRCIIFIVNLAIFGMVACGECNDNIQRENVIEQELLCSEIENVEEVSGQILGLKSENDYLILSMMKNNLKNYARRLNIIN